MKFIVSNSVTISQYVVRVIFVHNDKAISFIKFLGGITLKSI